MKVQLVAVFLFLFARYGTALELPQAILNLFAKPAPRLPPFVYSIEHPWLAKNRPWLERMQDPVKELCSPDGKLRPGSGDVPADLFRHLSVNSRHPTIDSDDARSPESNIRDILSCTTALQDVESIDVAISVPHQYAYISHDLLGDLQSQVDDPIEPELPKRLTQLLIALPNLSKLQWRTTGNWNVDFCEAFEDANLTLPSVTYLDPAPGMTCLVEICPNLATIEATQGKFQRSYQISRDPTALVEATSHARHLSNFTMAGGWEFEHIEGQYILWTSGTRKAYTFTDNSLSCVAEHA